MAGQDVPWLERRLMLWDRREKAFFRARVVEEKTTKVKVRGGADPGGLAHGAAMGAPPRGQRPRQGASL